MIEHIKTSFDVRTRIIFPTRIYKLINFYNNLIGIFGPVFLLFSPQLYLHVCFLLKGWFHLSDLRASFGLQTGPIENKGSLS